MTEPRMPQRVRLHRPDLWRDETSGRLAPDVRDLYAGLSTLTDDRGWILWRPTTLAAQLYPYEDVAARERQLARLALSLVDVGLLVLHPCGCGQLPRMARDFAQKGGDPTSVVHDYHQSHLGDVGLRSALSPSVDRARDVGLQSATYRDSVSVSDSVSDSVSAPTGDVALRSADGAGDVAIAAAREAARRSLPPSKNGHDERWDRERQESIVGLLAGTLTGAIADEVKRQYAITDADLASPVADGAPTAAS